jgi:hypothetical protein
MIGPATVFQRPWARLAALLAFLASVTALVFAAIERPAAPAALPLAPLRGPLSQHVLLVVVDGLRYDVATNPRLMPAFARAMAERSSAEIWAGRVSMTSSAILGYGTGQPGRLEQVVRNLHAEVPPYNSWLHNARSRGLALCAVGDPAWPSVYAGDLDCHRCDPEGVAIDVDFNAQTFRDARELLATSPNFMVAHFVTPDHQGHAYGIQSARYAAHIHDFDAKLAAWLDELTPEWTVLVTSDHGAADSGTHGTDVPVQRRSPLYAYGPGIRDGVHAEKRFEQVDLSATLPLLLGVAPPAHGTGRVLVELLALEPAEAANVTCAQATRTLRYGEHVAGGAALAPARDALTSCAATHTVAERELAAERATRSVDDAVSEATGLSAPSTLRWLALVLITALAFGAVLLGRIDVRGLLFGAAISASSVYLVLGVERLPGIFPNVVRIAFFVFANLLLCGLVLRPAPLLRLSERALPFTAGLIPGALACTYPADARPEAYVIVALLIPAYFLWPARYSSAAAAAPTPKRAHSASRADLAALLVGLVLLLPVALREDGTYSSWLADATQRAAVATAVALLWLAWQHRALAVKPALFALLAAFTVAPLWLRPVVPPLVGRGAWLACAVLLILGVRWRRYDLALLAGVVSVLWVSREFEAVPLIAAATLAWLVGGALGRQERPLTTTDILLLALLGLSLVCALRVGQQNGLDFGGMDWGAGAFGDANVPAWLIGCALGYKYLAAGGIVVLGFSRKLGSAERWRLARALTLTWTARAVALSAMFVVAGNSFWTAMRVIGELPAALAFTAGSLVFAELLRSNLAESSANRIE